MKVTRVQAEANRERVVETAARLFREHGFDGIGLNELMQAAGLTRGGFYGQFASKEALIQEASARAFEENQAAWRKRARGPDALTALLKMYLSGAHRDHPGQGCSMAALGGEAARATPELRKVFAEGVQAYLGELTPLMAGPTPELRRRQALATHAMLLGALIVARATRGTPLSDEMRAAVTATVLQAAEGPDAESAT